MTEPEPTFEHFYPGGAQSRPATTWTPPQPPETALDRSERELAEQLADMQRLLNVVEHPEKLRPLPIPEPSFEDYFPEGA